jgi:RNA polymerase sigma-70 factor (ECF subfamily)
MSTFTPVGEGFEAHGFSATKALSQADERIDAINVQVLGLFDEMRRPILHHLLWMRLSPDTAEDIVQETFFRLFLSLRRNGVSPLNLRGWAWRVAHNQGLRSLSESGGAHLRLDADPDSLADTLADPAPNPEQEYYLRQTEERLHREFEGLNRRERDCIHLRAQGLANRQIAALLKIPKSTVSDIIRRVVSRIRS